jgi:hypothetical protein
LIEIKTDEARRIAANIVKLPEPLPKSYRLWSLVVARGSDDEGYGLGEQDPPFPSRSDKHCSNVVYRHCGGVSGLLMHHGPFCAAAYFSTQAIAAKAPTMISKSLMAAS